MKPNNNKLDLDLSYFRIVSDSERGDCGLKLTTEDTKSEEGWLAYWTAEDFAECSEVDFEDEVLSILKDIVSIVNEKAKTIGQGVVNWRRCCDTDGNKFLTTKSPRGRIKIFFQGISNGYEPFRVFNNLNSKDCGILELRQLLTSADIPHPSDDDFKWLKGGE